MFCRVVCLFTHGVGAERVHGGLRPVALLFCLTVCAVTGSGVVRGG